MIPTQTALLVIDMQNDFVADGALLEVKGIRRNISSFKSFIDFCREKKILVIYTRHCYDPKKNPIEATLFNVLKKSGLRKGKKGWQISSFLEPSKDDIVIDKTRYDAFFKTPLYQILKKRKIRNLIITGTMTDICCESTARAAMFHDFHIFFCNDLTYTSLPSSHRKTLRVIESHFGKVVSLNDLKKMILS